MRADAAALLARLGHERIDPRLPVRALRPAAQQIVSIARALSYDARVLIMDEPSAILDAGEVETLFEVVRRLTAEGVGVVYISHRLDEIRRIGDRVTVLADGATAADGIAADTPTDELVRLMVGRKVERLYPERPRGGGEVLLEVRDAAGAAGGPRGQLRGAGGGGARDRRPGRLRAQRAAAVDLRARPARSRRGDRRRAAAARRTGPTGRSPPGSASPPRTASRRGCCSTGT